MSWHTTYRPTKFGDMALYPELRTWLEMYEATGEFDHLLFYGDVGTGKTTAAYILANAVMDDFSVDRILFPISCFPPGRFDSDHTSPQPI